MIDVSDAWKEAHKEYLLPETFIQISCGLYDVEIPSLLTVSAESEAAVSDKDLITGATPSPAASKTYATLERNLWQLDGYMAIRPDEAPNTEPGYVSAQEAEVSVTLTASEVRDTVIPGLTITWGNNTGDYPTDFSIEAKNGDTVVASTTVTGNATWQTKVDLELTGYDSITIRILAWRLPYRRARIRKVGFGHVLTFTKNDVLSYTHEQNGCLNSGEIPKNSIEFSLDNTDGKWNPSNPTGLARYLSERQTIEVLYGMNVGGGTTSYIKAGTFYLSEWRAPANGLEATFAARDIFEYLINAPYTGPQTDTLYNLIEAGLAGVNLPTGFTAIIDSSLRNYTGTLELPTTVGEVIQRCGNAGCCGIWQDHDGWLRVKPVSTDLTDYTIGKHVSYTHPEVELSKQLRAVTVSYQDGQSYTLEVGSAGETQTVENPVVSTAEQAAALALWVKNTLVQRKTVTGEFRADPRLELFDVIAVDSKYGALSPVAITNIRYSYNGAFRGSYTGRVIETDGSSSILGQFILGKSALGTEV